MCIANVYIHIYNLSVYDNIDHASHINRAKIKLSVTLSHSLYISDSLILSIYLSV